tara:strand:+ start:632 stop:991 length:360 start_codon:yes stop_codon:yes gene_type:complete
LEEKSVFIIFIVVMGNKKEYNGKPFTKANREQSLKDISMSNMDEKRTVCNVVRLIFQNAQDEAYNLGAIRELALEAMWMGKRMNDKLTEYRQQEMYEEYIDQKDSNLNYNYDLAQGNWD